MPDRWVTPGIFALAKNICWQFLCNCFLLKGWKRAIETVSITFFFEKLQNSKLIPLKVIPVGFNTFLNSPMFLNFSESYLRE
jgi:hypothetical protein